MKRKTPKRTRRAAAPRPSRAPNPGALEAVNQALLCEPSHENWNSVAMASLNRREETKDVLRQRVAAHAANASHWQQRVRHMESENETLRAGTANLMREVAEWKLRFDRLLEAMQHR
jgi:hypothetical protein